MYSFVSRPLCLTAVRALAFAACASGLLIGCNSIAGGDSTITNGSSSGTGSIGGNGTGSSSSGGTQTSYTIGGTVIGLSGTGLVLANNAGDNLTITGNGGFTFSNHAAGGATYKVTIQSQPVNPSQVCTVMNGVGTVGTVNVASVTVSCTTNFYNVGGSVTGLTGSGLVLQTNGTNDVSVASPGNYVFSTLASGSNYTVTVMTQPSNPSQTCTVANDTGQVTGANVTNVAITCTTNNYAISGSVSGLTGAGLVLQTNGANPVSIAGSGSYTFATLPSGAAYAITVMTPPGNPSQTCTIGNGTGTIVSADVTNVSVSCVTNLYSIGGTVTGLNGTALMLQDNGGDNLSVVTNGSFTFGTGIASNMTYAVTVATAPSNPAQLCRVTGGTGTVTTANVTTVSIVCTNTGRFVFLANPFDHNGDGTVAAFRINPLTGALTAAAGSPYIPTELQPYALALDPNGQYLYVANSGSNIVSSYGIGPAGALTLDVSTAVTGSVTNFPYSLAVDPAGPYLYVGSDDTINGTLEAYSINAGVLTPVTGVLGTSTYPAGNVPFGLALDLVNARLYAANYYDSTLVGDSIGAPGTLTAVAGSPFAFQGGNPINQPFGIAIHPTGGFMYITDSVANTVTEYSYGANGVPVQGVSYAVGQMPKGLTIDPTGVFLYVSNSGDGTVSAFRINAADGSLTGIGGPYVSTLTNLPSSFTPTTVQVDPSGQFAYVANGDDGTVTVFRINLTTGTLTQVGAKVQTFMVGGAGGPSSIAIE